MSQTLLFICFILLYSKLRSKNTLSYGSHPEHRCNNKIIVLIEIWTNISQKRIHIKLEKMRYKMRKIEKKKLEQYFLWLDQTWTPACNRPHTYVKSGS